MTAPLYPQATTAAEITANLAHINARIAAACAACGRVININPKMLTAMDSCLKFTRKFFVIGG